MSYCDLIFIVILTILRDCIAAGKHAQFECGDHGRFEYCIDEIPGCVIGCYCHPGYYFDTDSKICEPNTKLTKGTRRSYNNDYDDHTDSPVVMISKPPDYKPTKSSTDVLSDKANKITNTVDELSDWLYNEFFKTVENQVVNKTDDNIQIINGRRKGSLNLGLKQKKKHKRSKKSKRKKVKGARITENDSLFDSSSSSSSDSSDSDDSDSENDSREYSSASNENHGHRKIIMIQKKPKPPLPSFVLMPDGGTNYYPPMQFNGPMMMPGPIMPGPMLPMPQMLAPFPPSIIVIDATNNTNATEKPNTVTINPQCDKHEEIPAETDKVTKHPQTDKPEDHSSVTEKPDVVMEDPQSDKPEDITAENSVSGNVNTTTRTNKETLRKLLKKKKHKNKSSGHKNKKSVKKIEPLSKEIRLTDLLTEDESMVEDDMVLYAENEKYRRSFNPNNKIPENLDEDKLKKILEFVYKMGSNNNSGSLEPDVKSTYNKPFSIKKNTFEKNAGSAKKANDNIYSELGKEIAMLVRKLDTNDNREKEVNIEIQSVNDNIPSSLVNENRYTSRTYWERIVRSPKKIYNISRNNPDVFVNSNERLRELENIVEQTASLAPALSLVQLESMIKTMEKENRNSNIKQKEIKAQRNRVKYHLNPKHFTANRNHGDKYNKNAFLRIPKLSQINNLINNLAYNKTANKIISNQLYQKDTRENGGNTKQKENVRYLSDPLIMNYKSTRYFTDDNVISNKLQTGRYVYNRPLYFETDLDN